MLRESVASVRPLNVAPVFYGPDDFNDHYTWMIGAAGLSEGEDATVRANGNPRARRNFGINPSHCSAIDCVPLQRRA